MSAGKGGRRGGAAGEGALRGAGASGVEAGRRVKAGGKADAVGPQMHAELVDVVSGEVVGLNQNGAVGRDGHVPDVYKRQAMMSV